MRDLSLHLLDIVQNSIAAKAHKIMVGIKTDTVMDKLYITIEDNGTGMDEEFLKQVTDPFVTTRTTRKVGLGISLFKAAAQLASGDMEISSVKGSGTIVKTYFKISHIDRQPLGDIAETFVNLIMAEPDINFTLLLQNEKDEFEFDSFKVREVMGEVPITCSEVLDWIREYIDEGIKAIFGGVLNEVTG